MKSMILKSFFLYLFFIFLVGVLTIIITLLLSIGKINPQSIDISILTFIVGIIIFFLFGILVGNHKQKRGMYYGFIYSLIIVILMFSYCFLGLNKSVEIQGIIKLITYLLATAIGGSIGVNIKPIL